MFCKPEVQGSLQWAIRGAISHPSGGVWTPVRFHTMAPHPLPPSERRSLQLQTACLLGSAPRPVCNSHKSPGWSSTSIFIHRNKSMGRSSFGAITKHSNCYVCIHSHKLKHGSFSIGCQNGTQQLYMHISLRMCKCFACHTRMLSPLLNGSLKMAWGLHTKNPQN